MSKRFNLFLIIKFFIINNINSEEPKHIFYKCGINENEMTPKVIENQIKIDNNSSLFKRRLDSDGFKAFNICLDLFNIEYEIEKYNLTEYHDLFIDSLKKAVHTLQSILRVKPLLYNYKLTNENLTYIKIEKWDTTKFGTEAYNKNISLYDLGIDLIIFGRFDTLNEGTLAGANAAYIQIDNGQPYVGIVVINKNVNYSRINSKEYFQSIILHEFTHILGFSSYYFINIFKNVFTKTDKFGINRTYINSTKVLEVAKKYFNCSDIQGIELENYGGEGTAGSHWEARILLGDYMNGVIYTEEQVISEFTLALLEDSEYYKANYFTGGLMRYGKNKGCSFLKEKCVNGTHEINPYFENEFYDSINSENLIDPSCSSGRQSRTYNAWWIHEDIPKNFQYFENETFGGWPPADYCPISINFGNEEQISYYSGHCSLKGKVGLYGTKIIYHSSNSELTNYPSKELLNKTGETFSDHSYCFLSSLIRNDTNEADYFSQTLRAICFEISCSKASLTVKINDDYIVCPRAGGKIEVEEYKGYFLCPDYNLMCSGTVLCNDMFDCVEKKSEIKEESYYYDYDIKTSQNIEKAEIENADNINNYELSENGICPINCKKCKENKKCVKCRDDYGLVGFVNEDKIECLALNVLNNGYYSNNHSIFYKCIENCETCKNGNKCDKCIENFYLLNNDTDKCVNIWEFPSIQIKSTNINSYINDKSQISYKYSIPISYSNIPENNLSILTTSIIKQSIINLAINSTYPILSSTYLKINNNTNSTNSNSWVIYHSLFILQGKIINNTLIVYAISDFPVPKNFSLIINIILYNSKRLRNLQSNEEKKEIKVYTTQDYKENSIIILFSLDKEFNEFLESRDDNNTIIRFEDLNVEDKENGKIYDITILNVDNDVVDFSNLSNDYKISQYKINSSYLCEKGCDFYFVSTTKINEDNKQIILNLTKSENDVEANCSLSKKNNNIIQCKSQKIIDEEFILKDSVYCDENGTITVVQENKQKYFKLTASPSEPINTIYTTQSTDIDVEENKPKTSKGKFAIGKTIGIIIAIILAVTGIIIAISLLIYYLVKKGYENKYYVDSNYKFVNKGNPYKSKIHIDHSNSNNKIY